jgi:hypothetical protein
MLNRQRSRRSTVGRLNTSAAIAFLPPVPPSPPSQADDDGPPPPPLPSSLAPPTFDSHSHNRAQQPPPPPPPHPEKAVQQSGPAAHQKLEGLIKMARLYLSKEPPNVSGARAVFDMALATWHGGGGGGDPAAASHHHRGLEDLQGELEAARTADHSAVMAVPAAGGGRDHHAAHAHQPHHRPRLFMKWVEAPVAVMLAWEWAAAAAASGLPSGEPAPLPPPGWRAGEALEVSACGGRFSIERRSEGRWVGRGGVGRKGVG